MLLSKEGTYKGDRYPNEKIRFENTSLLDNHLPKKHDPKYVQYRGLVDWLT